MDRNPRWLLTILVLLAASGWQAAPAGADVTQSDGVVKVTLVGARKINDQVWSGARRPIFRIQVLTPNTPVGCRRSLDAKPGAPCGTEQSSGCPARQCWTYSMSVGRNASNSLYVDYTGAYDTSTYLEFDFNTYAAPPQTTMNATDREPPVPWCSGLRAPILRRELQRRRPAPGPLPVRIVGAIGGLGALGKCRWAHDGDDPDLQVVLPRLRRMGIYRFRARAVDVFGLEDPTPAQYVFSPTPCRASVRGRTPSYSQIVGHGLPLIVRCIEPGRFEIDLNVPPSWAFNCGGATTSLGYLLARTTRLDQTLRLRLRTHRCAPRPASGVTRIPLQLIARPLGGFGANQERKFSARA